jgi:hypothetical protein
VRAARRPIDSFAIFAAAVTSVIIIVNAMFLQSGSHPAPFFANPTHMSVSVESRFKLAELAAPKEAPAVTASHPIAAMPTPQPVAARRNDPIAELIASSARVRAVQRVLTEYGYGQIKPSGILDGPTSTAIEKFERERKLPVTGRVSDHLVSELGVLAGHSIE